MQARTYFIFALLAVIIGGYNLGLAVEGSWVSWFPGIAALAFAVYEFNLFRKALRA